MRSAYLNCCFLSVIFCTLAIRSVSGLISLGILGIDLDLVKKENPQCNTTGMNCQCGFYPFSTVTIQIPQCTKFHRFKAKCAPCNDMTAEKICPIFQNCLECTTQDGGRCARCSSGRFGQFCEHQCSCENGGTCDSQGTCICNAGFEGTLCERKSGCDRLPPVAEPLRADYHPADQATSIVYSCPEEYQLIGSEVSTCLPDKQWSGTIPRCLKSCPLLSEPGKGTIKYNNNRLTEGVRAEITCFGHHRLRGQSVLRCRADGTWDSELPRCEELALCSDPGANAFTQRLQLDSCSKIGKHFVEGCEIEYKCEPGFHQFNGRKLICTAIGTWSQDLPRCMKVSVVTPECETKGSDVVDEVGIPVRISCPPECAKNIRIWGTSIYRIDSSICVAAIHSGKLTNSGGQVEVINNGDYTSFAGSTINNIVSYTYDGRGESFRFDKVQPLSKGKRNPDGCPIGMKSLEETCIYVSNLPLPHDEAEAVCTNLGLQMLSPSGFSDVKTLSETLRNEGINELWTGERPPTGNINNFSDATCSYATVEELDLVWNATSCDEKLTYVCVLNHTSTRLASCADPGALENGDYKPIGKLDESFFVGSSIEYSCEPLHYLKGVSKIYCLSNGTWSDEKPTCIKVDTCEDLPIPYGGFVNYLQPSNQQMTQRIAHIRPGSRGFGMPRLPVGLEARPPQRVSTTPQPDFEIQLPPGRHRVGTRAMFDCESRYYSLVGSRTRRCEKSGQWSGRSTTCIPICGRSDSTRLPFIVNGNASDIGQWPWQAGLARYIQDYDVWYVLCGGSLLNERWVITAAHCVTYAGTTLPIDPDKFRIYMGKYHRNDSKDDEYVQIRSIREVHIHPDYEPQIFDADIALLLLETPVQLNTRVQPVCLPSEESSKNPVTPGAKGVVTGWGTNENGSHAETLQQAVVPVVSNEECEEGYEKSDMPLTVTENMFCAGYKEGRVDSCSGDSGGPVVFLDESAKPRRWIIEGIVSWGSPTGCGNANQYGGYTRVSRFLDWIHLFF